MTEREVLDRQELTGNQDFFLVLVGSFYHAYGHAAFALSRVTGYHVRRKNRSWGELYVAGFHAGSMANVEKKIVAAGGNVVKVDSTTWSFRGVDGTPFQVPEEKAEIKKDYSWLAKELGGFNLSQSTPLDALLFIGRLQKQLVEEPFCTDDGRGNPAG